MMYIMMKNPNYHPAIKANFGCSTQPKILEMHWHIGEKLPFGITDHNVHEVVAVQADGDELDWIKFHCLNIPMCHQHRVVTWRGESAQFIVDAIRQAPKGRT